MCEHIQTNSQHTFYKQLSRLTFHKNKPTRSPQTAGPFRGVCSPINSSNNSPKMKRIDATSPKSTIDVSCIVGKRAILRGLFEADYYLWSGGPWIRATIPLRGSLVRNRAESLPIIMPILSPVCDRCSYCSRRYDDPSETCVGSHTCTNTGCV